MLRGDLEFASVERKHRQRARNPYRAFNAPAYV
jgi:hypothetical protein